ncbi:MULTISPECIES: HpcH/HpaI aldolase/citrate lyase family protein [Lentibacter]|jgi:(3S)-malyl-CoA thioesterase|uniref:(3S)-malyl-CoA thioesterase n=1 Tax=Lentibacter algarum TaxID=576131 RepID=A0A1H3HSA6_9RHOB|nr:CoA ester lyase [Lentibacter algarum]MCO4776111.1 CoA ester lyase [Lentibacter algarum]MCO4827820.1 CoA ester lyase [Lentibacter algarum]WIF31093.1 putative citrate lyase subunit beta [Lentibacter algarum]SDY18322.1 (3S)-malyl-CoA thioesterase [Lentibacter algarum]
MDMPRPYRSVLYIPASKERALDKARSLDVDAIIFDLEDAVTPDAKVEARDTLKAALKEGGYGARAKIIRLNGLDSAWGREDAEAMKDAEADAFLLPKVSSAADVEALAAIIGKDKDIWAMIETPMGVMKAEEIAAHPQMKGFVAGTNDLAKELNCRFRADRLPMITSLSMMLLAAKAHGIVAIDGVYNQFKDDEGLAAECAQGRDMGFEGKTLIHPAQVAVCNEAFSPSAEEIDLAERQIAAFEETEASGQGVAVVDGKIVENLHVETARKILALAEAVSAR